jgi:hypothetical protein
MGNQYTIWKFLFSIQDEFELEMPDTPFPLTVQLQDDVPCMWAIVNPNAPKAKKRFRVYGTGHPIGELSGQHYIGTIQQNGFVWHIFSLSNYV